MLDNQFALLFIRGERPVKDLKYDILKHPNVIATADGEAEPYVHGSTDEAVFSIEFMQVLGAAESAGAAETEPSGMLLLSEEDVEAMIANEEKDRR